MNLKPLEGRLLYRGCSMTEVMRECITGDVFCKSLNLRVVEGGGFEPPKAAPTDLQFAIGQFATFRHNTLRQTTCVCYESVFCCGVSPKTVVF